MRVITAPAALPAAPALRLLEDDAPAALLRRTLALLRPDLPLLAADAPAPPGAIPLTCAPERAFAADAPAELLYLPVVDRVTWPWWSFAERLLDKHRPAETAGGAAGIALEDFVAFLLDWPEPPITLAINGVTPVRKHYAPWAAKLSVQRGAELAMVRARLDDERSRRHYDAVASGDPLGLWALYVESVYHSVQYFDYVALAPGDVVLSVGVDEGFDTPYLLGMVGPHGVVHHLDPFADDRLNPYPRRAVAACPQSARFHRVAVSDQVGETEICLSQGGEAIGASLGRTLDPRWKRMTTPTTSIDAFVSAQNLARVDYIKIDTEGAEPLILEGLQETIARFRPALAVSIYHHPDHFWSLPWRLMTLCREYNFYVSHYSFMAWDTLIYAIPKEKPMIPPHAGPPAAQLLV